jgi:hypothetical protein
MKLNVGSLDRWLRGVGGLALVAVALVVALPLPLRVLGGVQGAYLVVTAIVGYCVGYRLLGRSTCPLR